MPRLPRAFLLGVLGPLALAASFGSGACSSDPATSVADGGGDPDGSSAADGAGGDDASATTDGATADAKSDGASGDAGDKDACPTPVTKPATGETCVGFGKKTPCGSAGACGYPDYGYVCFNGGPPGFAGCVQASTSAFGETYCCPDNKCVAEPDQDAMCAGVAGKPHRYQCPPDGLGGNVAAPAGCVANGTGASELEKFFCCP